MNTPKITFLTDMDDAWHKMLACDHHHLQQAGVEFQSAHCINCFLREIMDHDEVVCMVLDCGDGMYHYVGSVQALEAELEKILAYQKSLLVHKYKEGDRVYHTCYDASGPDRLNGTIEELSLYSDHETDVLPGSVNDCCGYTIRWDANAHDPAHMGYENEGTLDLLDNVKGCSCISPRCTWRGSANCMAEV